MPEQATCPECGAALAAGAPHGLCPKCLLGAGLVSSGLGDTGPTVPETHPIERAATDRIGRYKILQKLGEGGCGIVYVADQEEPVKRRVALKVIKLGMDSRQVIARFEAERQALALMDHSHIAKVLDGGTTLTGQPFFVMELVRGIPITRYCDENRLDTAHRLELFILVCQAIQHAHQKGIIHRDIKPSNILVADHDGVPVPKVIDFGIAKATAGQTLTDKTLFTAFEQFIGTPAYMSPEQAKLSGLDIDTRSDIYSLGVLLYELLTGKTPFDAKRLMQGGLEEICRIIREEEPPRPSTKLSTLDVEERTTLARQRQCEPPKLASTIRGDLDWIVMKTLEKDRNRRYETANELAVDLKRYLTSEPVVARPPSNFYRFQKLVRRNRLAFGATVAVAGALLLGLGLSSWLFLRERVEALKSQQVAEFLKEMLEGVGPSVAKGRDTVLLGEILDRTAERVGKELTNQPAIEADLFTTIGEVYRGLTSYKKAEAFHRQALALRQRLWGERNEDVATSMDDLAVVLLEQTKLEEAEALFLKSLTTRTQLFGAEDAFVALSLSNLGVLRQSQGRLPEAESLYRRALDMRRKLLGSQHPAVAESLLCLASALWREHKDLTNAEAMNLEALAIRKKLFGEVHPDLAPCLNNLATVYQDDGKDDEAEAAFHSAMDLWKRMLGDGSAQEAQVLNNLGWFLCSKGKMAEAETMLKRSLDIRRRVLGNKHDDVAQSLNTLAVVLQRRGNFAQAEQLQREQLELTIELHGGKHPYVAASKNNLAWVLRSEGKLQDAETLLREALALQRELVGPTNEEVVQLLHNVGALCAEQGNLANAQKAHQEALAIRLRLSGPKARETAGSLFLLAHTLCDEGKPAEAETLARQAVDILESKQPDRWSTYSAKALLGRSLAAQNKYDSAEPLLLAGCQGLEPRLETIPVDKRLYFKEALQNLIQLYQATGRSEIAAPWQRKLSALEGGSQTVPGGRPGGKP